MNNAVFGKYFNLDSSLHRLDPRSKFLLLLSVLFNISAYKSGWLISAVLIFWGIGLSNIPYGYFRKGLKMFTWFFIFTGSFHLMFTPGRNILPFSLGGLYITYEGVNGALFYIIRLAMIIVCAALFTSTTSANRIASGIEKTISPLSHIGVRVQDISIMLMIAITFIPVVFEEAHRLTKAQAARGIDFSKGGLVNRALHLKAIFIPLFVGTVRKAENLALAMESRGYDGRQKRSSFKPLAWGKNDWLSIGLIFLVFGGSYLLDNLIV